VNSVLGEKFEQINEPIDIAVVEKEIEQPKVFNNGLYTTLNGNTLRSIEENWKGTSEDANTIIVKFTKDRTFVFIGRLRRFYRFYEARQNIVRNNAILCPHAIKELDRDGIERSIAVIIYKTQDIDNCAKITELYKQEQQIYEREKSNYRKEERERENFRTLKDLLDRDERC
jgi:hypothetical protein